MTLVCSSTDRVAVPGGGPQGGQVHHVAPVPPLAVEVVPVLQEVDVEVNWNVVFLIIIVIIITMIIT